MQHFILAPDGEPTPVDMETWARWFEQNIATRVVAKTYIGDDVQVSTVFIGIDHNWSGQGDPLVFETMIFGGLWDEYQWRYTLRTEAQARHDAIVAALRAGHEPPS